MCEETGERQSDATVRARMIGEWCGGDLLWGVELYWVEDGVERYRRARTLTERLEAVSSFCKTVDRAAVSPIHAAEILLDFCDGL